MTRSLHRSLLTCFIAWLCAVLTAQTVQHVVQPGETIYSISQAYGISSEQLRSLNPRMGETLYAGQSITVPGGAGKGECKCMYEVKRKETVYSIARYFGVSEDELRAANPQIKKDKVKKGAWLCIPYTQQERQAQQRQQEEQRQRAEAQAEAERRAHLNVAVILPFDLGAETRTNEATKMLDFYEGFLLAVDELKGQGVSVDVYAYEEVGSGSIAMQRITAQPMLPHADLIIGPLKQENIPPLTDFANRRGIPIVVPFSTSPALVEGNPMLFQANTPTATLYPHVYDLLLPLLRQGNIVFLEGDDSKRQIAFIDGLQARLTQENIPFRTAHTADMVEAETFLPSLNDQQTNILIPTSNTQAAFESVVRRLGAAEEYAQHRFSLIGYPEWQTFSQANKQAMRKYNATFFTTFHTDTTAPGAKAFAQTFQRWFHKPQFPSYPLYGMHGYDIGRFFLTALSRYGQQFVDNLDSVGVNSLQLPLQFQRQAPGSGFVNQAVRLVTTDATPL